MEAFFWSSPNFGQKVGLNFSEDLFFNFWRPSIDLRTHWKNLSLRPGNGYGVLMDLQQTDIRNKLIKL